MVFSEQGVKHHKMLNENFKGHENQGKIYEGPHVPKKGTLF